MGTLCDELRKSSQMNRLINEQGYKKNELKNLFIGLSNILLKGYKDSIEVDTLKKQESFVQYKEEKKLLKEQNELLHSTYAKARQLYQELPVPQLDLDLKIEVPKNVLVVKKDGTKVPLNEYLPDSDSEDEEFRNSIAFYERRLKELREARAKSAYFSEQQIKKVEDAKLLKKKRVKIIHLNKPAPSPCPQESDF